MTIRYAKGAIVKIARINQRAGVMWSGSIMVFLLVVTLSDRVLDHGVK